MVIAGAVAFIIAAIGSMVVQIINAKAAADERIASRASRAKLEAYAEINDGKNDKIIKQGAAIEHSTNSNLSKVTSDLAVAITKIEGLEKIVAHQNRAKNIADNLALTATTTELKTPEIPLPIPIKIVDESTRLIEKKEKK